MNRLLEIGYQPAGHWVLQGDELSFQLLRFSSKANVLYAFVSDGAVKYVGKTTQSLGERLNGYRNPGRTQYTNQKNNANIKALLGNGAAVDILVLPDDGLLHFGQFHINLAAGLEDSIISVIQPEWNRRRGSIAHRVASTSKRLTKRPNVITTITLIVYKTYYSSGFFNVSVKNQKYFGGDGEEIEIFCGESSQPTIGYINRSANMNNTPRIMGGVALKRWFQENVTLMQEVLVEVLSPNSIRIRPKDG